MADTHRVILTAEALHDLEGIAQCIREQTPQAAASVAESILDRKSVV